MFDGDHTEAVFGELAGKVGVDEAVGADAVGEDDEGHAVDVGDAARGFRRILLAPGRDEDGERDRPPRQATPPAPI